MTPGATGTATLHGLPTPIDATIVDHVATFTLPAGLPVGGYQLHAGYGGDSQYGSSESAVQQLTVGQGSGQGIGVGADQGVRLGRRGDRHGRRSRGLHADGQRQGL